MYQDGLRIVGTQITPSYHNSVAIRYNALVDELRQVVLGKYLLIVAAA